MSITFATNRCPICNKSQLYRVATPTSWLGDKHFFVVKHQLGLSQCRNCSLIFTNPRPSTELLDGFYAAGDYEPYSRLYSSENQSKLRYIHSYILNNIDFHPGYKFLDFGCGAGSFLVFAKAAGWDATGYDISQTAVNTCLSQNLSATCKLSDIPKSSMDVILLNHVIEHLENPIDVLNLLAEALTPRGLIVLATPNVASLRARLSTPLTIKLLGFDERYHSFPIHLYYFCDKSLSFLLQKASLKIKDVSTYGLGIDSLLKNSPPNKINSAIDNPTSVAQNNMSSIANIIKNSAKNILFKNALLGENLIIAATRA